MMRLGGNFLALNRIKTRPSYLCFQIFSSDPAGRYPGYPSRENHVMDKDIQHTVQKVQLEVVAKILAEFEGIPNHRIAAFHFAGIEFL